MFYLFQLDYDSETENDNSTITGNEDNDHGDSNNTTSSSTVFRNVMEKDLDWMKNCFLVFNGSQQDFHQVSILHLQQNVFVNFIIFSVFSSRIRSSLLCFVVQSLRKHRM